MSGVSGVRSVITHQPWADRLRQAATASREDGRKAIRSDPSAHERPGRAGSNDRISTVAEGRANRTPREAASPTGEGFKALQGQAAEFKKALDGIASLQKAYAESLINAARRQAEASRARADDEVAPAESGPLTETSSPPLLVVQPPVESRATTATGNREPAVATQPIRSTEVGAGGTSGSSSPASTSTAPGGTATSQPVSTAPSGQTNTTAPTGAPEATSTSGTGATSTGSGSTSTTDPGTSATPNTSSGRGSGKHVDKRV